jgi:hypothetical protein
MTAADASKPENMKAFLMTLTELQTKIESQDPTERDFPALKAEIMSRKLALSCT